MTSQTTIVLAVLALTAFMGLVGYACGSGRGRGAAGFLLGIFLGPLGWVIALLLPASPSRWRPRRRRR